jgi:hypothetical protein
MVERRINRFELRRAIKIFSQQNPQTNLSSIDAQRLLAEWIFSFKALRKHTQHLIFEYGNKNADNQEASRETQGTE